jgi:hypothetical protein
MPRWGRELVQQQQQDIQHAVVLTTLPPPARGLFSGMIQRRRQKRWERNCLEAHVVSHHHHVNVTGGDGVAIVEASFENAFTDAIASSTRTSLTITTTTPWTGRTTCSPSIHDDEVEEEAFKISDCSQSVTTAATSPNSPMSVDLAQRSHCSSRTLGTQQRSLTSLIDEDDEDDDEDDPNAHVPDMVAMFSSMSEVLHNSNDWNAAFLSSEERRLMDGVKEIFPNADTQHVMKILRQSSYNTTLLILAEESTKQEAANPNRYRNPGQC